jgi:hypothetical protein
MVNNILASSKKTSDMARADLSGRMDENTREAGCTVNKVESDITATIMALKERELGSMEKDKSGWND